MCTVLFTKLEDWKVCINTRLYNVIIEKEKDSSTILTFSSSHENEFCPTTEHSRISHQIELCRRPYI